VLSPSNRPSLWTVACAADNQKPHLTEAAHLFRTMRYYGGHLSTAEAIMYVVGTVSAEDIDALLDLNVHIQIVEPVSPENPYANKLSILEHHIPGSSLLALDTDILCYGDPLDYLSDEAFCAKPVDQDPLSFEQWEWIFTKFGISMPQTRYLSSSFAKDTIPYFNSGVLSIPEPIVSHLFHAWKHCLFQLKEIFTQREDINKHRFYADQIALAVAVAKLKIPFRALPLALNFPTHAPLHPVEHPNQVAPVFLHHHHNYDVGTGYRACGYECADSAILSLNEFLSKPTQQLVPAIKNDEGFDNNTFWNERYTTNPHLGSGIGSRGENAVFKRGIISAFMKNIKPASILDVGCGDMEVIAPIIGDTNYTGVDISETITASNRSNFPEFNFESRDFSKEKNQIEEKFELIMCFDVLIHQHKKVDYENIIESLIRNTGRIGLVSGYLSYPRTPYRSNITSYHEPLTRTLKRYGARDISIIASYRDTCVVSFKVS
jgi:2-polyprenyl-3-methyl-5-hydroxy-6-metoxy-1,4-benzoquinol methylase